MLTLSIPEQKKTLAADVSTEPAETERWLAQLPVLDPAGNLQKILAALSALNRYALKAPLRFDLLERYNKPTDLITENLAARLVGGSLPLSNKTKAIAEQIRELQTEMAYGYKAVVLETAERAYLDYKDRSLMTSIHRAIRHLTKVLLKSYEVYAAPPDGTWRELHQLWMYADTLGITGEQIQDESNKTTPLSDIDHAYKHALLLGLSNPYHLPFRMIDKIDAYLDKWAPLAQLTEAAEPSKKTCQFLIQLDSDRPGIPCPGEPLQDVTEPYQTFDTRPLVRRFHTQLTALDNDDPMIADDLDQDFFDEQAKDMLRRMVISWGLSPTRRFSRTEKEESCALTIGIDSVNYFLNGEKQFELKSEESELEITMSTVGVQVHHHIKHRHNKYETKIAKIIDEGAEGLGLTIKDAGEYHLSVGNLVAVRSTHQNAGWTVGLLRWIKAPNPEEVEIGIQKLSPCANAVVVQPVRVETRQSRDFDLAVLLPEMPALKQPPTLITHKGVFQPERNLFLETEHELQMIRAKCLIERTRSMEWFEFTVLDI